MKPDQIIVPVQPRSDVSRRLRSAAGHLAGVIRMVEQGRECDQVLHQLEAVQAAIRAAARTMLADDIRARGAAIRDDPDPRSRAAELEGLHALFRQATRARFLGEEVTR